MPRVALHIRIFCLLFGVLLLASCGSESASCEGPTLDFTALTAYKKGTRLSGASSNAKGFVVLPNPMEATRNNLATATSSATQAALAGFQLSNLLSPSRLESEFVKIRQQSITETISNFAKPDANGNYKFDLTDKRYWETMAYTSIEAEIAYFEGLGFKFVRSRPLFVMVNAKSSEGESSSPNAFYNHGYFSPDQPRTIQLFGEGDFAPGMDADMYRHEMGHFLNESVSAEVGFDFAGDSGAYFTQGAAMHEAFADLAAMSIGDKPNVGKWVARGIQGFAPGQPLRSAIDSGSRFMVYQDVSFANAKGSSPERYQMAEWITRVLWGIRAKIIAERGADKGPINSDLLMYSGLSLLKRDASVTDLRNAIVKADQKLYCGGHGEMIKAEFEKRGFTTDPPPVTEPITITAQPAGLKNGQAAAAISPGGEVSFTVSLTNSDRVVARNVRVRLESADRYLIATTYQQGYGDLAAGQSISVGNNGWPLASAVVGRIDSRAPRGSQIRFKLRVLIDNGPSQVFDGSIQL